MMLSADHLSYHAGKVRLLDDVSLQLRPGHVHAVLGPNGAGKSTLLKLLAGDLSPDSGTVRLNGCDLHAWSMLEQARQRAVLPQAESLRFGFSSEQVVALGRLPCLRHTADREAGIVHEALAAAGAGHLAQRAYPSLSGGERARVQLARVLAQIWEPALPGGRYLLLDEPTASQDLAHQHACLKLARKFSAQAVGILAILHDPNLALRYADDVTLLHGGRVLAQGTPEQVLTPKHLEQLYGIAVDVLQAGGNAQPYISVHTQK